MFKVGDIVDSYTYDSAYWATYEIIGIDRNEYVLEKIKGFGNYKFGRVSKLFADEYWKLNKNFKIEKEIKEWLK